MKTSGKVICPLPGCGHEYEDNTVQAPLYWILHMQFHLFYERTDLPEGVG